MISCGVSCRVSTVLLGISLLVILLPLGAPAGAQTITIWHPWGPAQGAYQAVRFLAREYTSQRTGTAIEFENAGLEKLMVVIAAGTPPDVFISGESSIPPVLKIGAAVPLDALDRNIAHTKADIYPGLVEELSRDGRLYGIPVVLNIQALFRNTEQLAMVGMGEAPMRDWDVLRTAAKRLTVDTNGDGQIDRWGFGAHGPQLWEVLLLQNGGEWLSPAGEPDLGTDAALRATSFFVDAWQLSGFSPVGSTNMQKSFQAGEVAMMVAPTGTGSFTAATSGGFHFDVSGLPVAARPANVTTGARALIMDTPRSQAAWGFVDYMTNTENAARYSTMTGGLMVARRSAYRTKTWVSQIGQAPWLAPDRLPAELEHVRAQPPVIALNLNKVTDAITNLLAAIRKGELAAQAALLRAEHEIRSAIW